MDHVLLACLIRALSGFLVMNFQEATLPRALLLAADSTTPPPQGGGGSTARKPNTCFPKLPRHVWLQMCNPEFGSVLTICPLSYGSYCVLRSKSNRALPSPARHPPNGAAGAGPLRSAEVQAPPSGDVRDSRHSPFQKSVLSTSQQPAHLQDITAQEVSAVARLTWTKWPTLPGPGDAYQNQVVVMPFVLKNKAVPHQTEPSAFPQSEKQRLSARRSQCELFRSLERLSLKCQQPRLHLQQLLSVGNEKILQHLGIIIQIPNIYKEKKIVLHSW